MHQRSGMPVLIVDPRGRIRWHEVFENNPYILRARPPVADGFKRIISGGGVRPYIALKGPTRWAWKPYRPKPAELFFTDAERAFAEPYRGMVMVEPNVKPNSHENKAWIASRWVELVDQLDLPWVQCVPQLATPHPGVKVLKVLTPTFRLACAVLSVAKAFVGTEGGLHHAAAAVGTPAVILWSEFISPDITGYDSMVNLRHAGVACGNRLNCKGCRASMDAITVDEVVNALKGLV